MSQVARGEVYSFRPVTQIRWRQGRGQLEGTVYFWIQEAESAEQPHSWAHLRVMAPDIAGVLPNINVLQVDPDYLGPVDWLVLKQAFTGYIRTLFEMSGWSGLCQEAFAQERRKQPVCFEFDTRTAHHLSYRERAI